MVPTHQNGWSKISKVPTLEENVISTFQTLAVDQNRRFDGLQRRIDLQEKQFFEMVLFQSAIVHSAKLEDYLANVEHFSVELEDCFAKVGNLSTKLEDYLVKLEDCWEQIVDYSAKLGVFSAPFDDYQVKVDCFSAKVENYQAHQRTLDLQLTLLVSL